jgi:hypothetical protein
MVNATVDYLMDSVERAILLYLSKREVYFDDYQKFIY